MKSEQEIEKRIRKLEQVTEKIIATRGYSEESNRLRLFIEFLKEQLRNEDTRYSTRQVR